MLIIICCAYNSLKCFSRSRWGADAQAVSLGSKRIWTSSRLPCRFGEIQNDREIRPTGCYWGRSVDAIDSIRKVALHMPVAIIISQSLNSFADVHHVIFGGRLCKPFGHLGSWAWCSFHLLGWCSLRKKSRVNSFLQKAWDVLCLSVD